jgi:hypothetical protein
MCTICFYLHVTDLLRTYALQAEQGIVASNGQALPHSVSEMYVSDEEMDAMDAADNFNLPRPHALSTSVRIHDAFRAYVSRPPLICAVCDEIQFLQPHDSVSTFGPGGAARWHHMTGAELLQFRSILSQQPGVSALPPAVVTHYQMHPSVG